MESNMGLADRIIRLSGAIAIGLLYYFGLFGAFVAAVMASIAGVFVFTGLLGFCPLYPIFNLSTRKEEDLKDT